MRSARRGAVGTAWASAASAAILVGVASGPRGRPLPAERPAIDTIQLAPTADARGAAGTAVLTRAASPFGMPLTPDGHVRYDVHVAVRGLPPDPHVFAGASAYVAWATVPDLSLARRLGSVGADGTTAGQVEWNKFIVLVTAERGATAAAHWSGPILLKGGSPSTWMQRFQSHVLNNGGNPQW